MGMLIGFGVSLKLWGALFAFLLWAILIIFDAFYLLPQEKKDSRIKKPEDAMDRLYPKYSDNNRPVRYVSPLLTSTDEEIVTRRRSHVR